MEKSLKLDTYVYSDIFVKQEGNKITPMVNFSLTIGDCDGLTLSVDAPFVSLLDKYIELNSIPDGSDKIDKKNIVKGLEEMKKILDQKIKEVQDYPN